MSVDSAVIIAFEHSLKILPTILLSIIGAVQDAITQACEFMKEQDHLTSLLHMKPLELSVKMLSGKNVGPLIEQMEKTVLANKNPHQLIVL